MANVILNKHKVTPFMYNDKEYIVSFKRDIESMTTHSKLYELRTIFFISFYKVIYDKHDLFGTSKNEQIIDMIDMHEFIQLLIND